MNNEHKFRYGQVWLVDLHSKSNNGSVQRKSRPMIVVSNDKNNMFSTTLNVIPLTSSRNNTRGAYQVQFYLNYQQYPQTILCEQITTISKDQCIRYLYTLSQEVINEMKLSMKIQLNL